MASPLPAATSIKHWSTPLEKTVEGQPPGPTDYPNTIEGEARSGVLRGITPNYKLGTEKPDSRIDLPHSGYIPNADGDYKVKQQQDHYKLTVIDPKVRSNANMPAHSATLPDPRRLRAGDFPSEHTKRSFVQVDPLAQIKLKTVDTKPVPPTNFTHEHAYHQRKKEVNFEQLWEEHQSKLQRVPRTDESFRELDSIKEKIATLQRAAAEPKKNDELDAMARKAEELARRARQNRADYHLTESEIITTKVDPMPPPIADQLRDLQASRTSIQTEATSREAAYVTDSFLFSGNSFSPRSVISVNGDLRGDELLRVHSSSERMRQEEKPRQVVRRREIENRQQMLYPVQNYHKEVHREIIRRPAKTETIQRFEQHRRTEEVERRVQRKERKDRRSSRHHSSSRRDEWRDGSHGDFHYNDRSYDRNFGRGGGFDDRYSVSSYTRRGSQGNQPFVEFPPTLPRHGRDDSFRPMHKSRSFADWDDRGSNGFRRDEWAVQQHRRKNDDFSRLEDEFRNSLLIPLNNGNMHERDHRTEQIPGGYETYHKENKANSGRRFNKNGVPVEFSEATQEYSYKREQESDRRR